MKASYIKALETQAHWYEWGRGHIPSKRVTDADATFATAFVSYTDVLRNAETIFMNHKFCDLVDFARLSVPDELAFEEEWMFTPRGFLFLEDPFGVPDPILDPRWDDAYDALVGMRERLRGKMKISAVSWMQLPDGGYYFMCYQNAAVYGNEKGFLPWSHFIVRAGDKVLERLHLFENTFRNDGTYVAGREMELKHEIRWVFTAMHMMSERVASFSKEKTSGLVRSMALRKKLHINPELRIVSLRRMEQDRQDAGVSRHVDWQWQWAVRGHWRLQPYKTLGDYKWKFIWAYIKGPENRPLKPLGRTVFKAVR